MHANHSISNQGASCAYTAIQLTGMLTHQADDQLSPNMLQGAAEQTTTSTSSVQVALKQLCSPAC
jgi:hypothetical protein